MNEERKLSGESELTKLKVLWRDSFAESDRDFWRALFGSTKTQSAIRQEIGERLQINLTYDKQLTAFRKWELEQRERDLEAERSEDDERRLQEEFGKDWTLEQIREEVLKRSYQRSIAEGDFKQGLSTAKVDMKNQELGLDRDKFELMKKKAEQADAARAVVESKLSPEEQQQRIRAIFGM